MNIIKLKNKKNIIFIATVCLLTAFMLLGFIIAEKNTRAIAFGDKTPAFYFCYNKEINVLKMDLLFKEYNISFDNQVKALKNIIKCANAIVERPYFK